MSQRHQAPGRPRSPVGKTKVTLYLPDLVIDALGEMSNYWKMSMGDLVSIALVEHQNRKLDKSFKHCLLMEKLNLPCQW